MLNRQQSLALVKRSVFRFSPRTEMTEENLKWLENVFRQTVGENGEISLQDFKNIVHSKNVSDYTYIPSYLPTLLSTYIHTSLSTYLPFYLYIYIPSFLFKYLPTLLSTYGTYLSIYHLTYQIFLFLGLP